MHVGLGRSSSQVAPRLSSGLLVLLLLIVHLHLLLHLLHLLLHLLLVLCVVAGGVAGGVGVQGLQADVGPGVLTAVQTGGHYCLSVSLAQHAGYLCKSQTVRVSIYISFLSLAPLHLFYQGRRPFTWNENTAKYPFIKGNQARERPYYLTKFSPLFQFRNTTTRVSWQNTQLCRCAAVCGILDIIIISRYHLYRHYNYN